VNLDHLHLGTQADNMREARERGRTDRPFGHTRTVGSKHGMAKLDEATAWGVKCALAAGRPQRAIAEEFGVSQATVSMVNTGQRWAHVHVHPTTT
jgi:hypothetical protein